MMGFCTDDKYEEFMQTVLEFEHMLARSGIKLFKYYLDISHAEQKRRLKDRRDDPLKQWKLSPVDEASLDKWDDYTKAKEAMFFNTDTADAPWTMVKSDCKKRARLNAMRYLLSKADYPNKDTSIAVPPDPLIVGTAADMHEKDEQVLRKDESTPKGDT